MHVTENVWPEPWASGLRKDDQVLAESKARQFAAVLLLLLTVAAALRLWRLNFFSYGLDEILQTYFVQGTWSNFWKSVTLDAVHPPLDYLITRAVEALHPADWVRKLPAVLYGLGTVGTLATLLFRRAGFAAGLFTALLLAFAPFHVRHSQEMRPYSLGLFLLCLSLLLLDLLLVRPGPLRLAAFYLASLATAYALYLAALLLGIAGSALLVVEAFSHDLDRRATARRFLLFSPLFAIALFVAYLPWLPVVLDAAGRPSPVVAPPLEWERFARLLSFFSFAPDDGQPLGRKGPLYLLLVGAGLIIAFKRSSTRFLAVWLLGGIIAIEALEQPHPHWYVSRHFLPAGIVFPALAALPLARLAERRRTRLIAFLIAALLVVLDLRSLGVYYREGRSDWRTLATYLAARPTSERLFTENQYSLLCVGFYLEGPDWLIRPGMGERDIAPLDGEPVRLTWSWARGTTAWLVLAGEPKHEALREWSSFFPSVPFPKAEGAILRRLDPALWGRMMATVPRPDPKR